jgi:hypothetical protein
MKITEEHIHAVWPLLLYLSKALGAPKHLLAKLVTDGLQLIGNRLLRPKAAIHVSKRQPKKVELGFHR